MRFAIAACHPKCQNARFATAACAKMHEVSAWRQQSPAAYKNHRFTNKFRTSDQREVTKRLPVQLKNLHFATVLDIQRAQNDERVVRAHREFAFHHSFGRSTITFCVKGCFGHVKNLHLFAFHHSFGRPTITFCVKGCFGNVKNLHFTTILGVRRARSPAATYQTYPAEKKRRNFKEEQHFKRSSIFEEPPFSAALLNSSSQQLFSAALLSSSSQQLFSAAFLSSPSQQPFSTAILSSFS